MVLRRILVWKKQSAGRNGYFEISAAKAIFISMGFENMKLEYPLILHQDYSIGTHIRKICF